MLRSSARLLLALLPIATAHAQLQISEIVADNDGSLLDQDGDASDWIELYNAGGVPASTAGLFLTDSADDLTAWPLPEAEVAAGGYLLIFASGKDRRDPGDEWHANFSLSSGGEYLALVAADTTTVLSEFAPEYPIQFFGTSFGIGTNTNTEQAALVPWPSPARWFVPKSATDASWRQPGFEDSGWTSAQTGIGFGYSLAGFIGDGGNTESEMRGNAPTVYLRVPFQLDDPAEVVSLSLRVHYEDGFVAYLNGHEVVADNVPDPVAYDSIALSSKEVRAGDPMIEFPLAFAGKLLPGENILAVHLLNNAVGGSDVLMVPELIGELQDLSGGVVRGYLESPTPGAPNASIEYTGYVRDTNFDIDRGFFDAPFEVTITCPTPGASIIYTTDGNAPTLENGTRVPAPDLQTPPSAVVSITTTTPLRAAAFKDGFRPSNIDTQTYFFLDDVLDQPIQPTGYPLPWRQRNGNTISGDYEMDANIVGPVYGRDELKAALLDVPTISIVTDIANLFDQQIGIQVNPQDSGPGSERRVSVEMLGFEDGAPVQVDAGMRMNGNASRSPTRPKHNFRLIFRNEYGAGKLDFPLFGASAPTESFNSIILRGGNGNSWVHPSASVYNNAMYIRDQWFRDAHFAMGYPEALQREVHVYFNGLYWGMHHLFERIEEEWSAERFGGEEADWEGFRIVGGNNIEVIQGTPQEEARRMLDSWQATLDAALARDLDTVQQYLDLDSFIDYLLLNFHAGNNDWDQNNVRAMRRINPPGKYMFFCHDAERAGLNALNTASVNINVTTKNTARGPTSINTALRSQPEYAMRFADRAYRHLFNGGALTAENGAAQWAARADGIREAMKAESARWGDFRGEPPRTLVNWENALQREYTQWFPARTPITISQLRAIGLYPDIDPPQFNQHGGGVSPGFVLVMSNENGDIYFTTDGSDPRLEGGDVNPAATRIDGSLIESELLSSGSEWRYLDDGTDLGGAWREPAFDDSEWSSGASPLGFGGISNTVLGTLVNDGRFLTCYFRKPLTVADTALLTEATVEVMADGGAVVYLNGIEIARDNMPAGPIAFATPSLDDGSPEGVFNSYTFDPSAFVEGHNVIAVELHNSSTSSSDTAIDLRLRTVGLNPDNGGVVLDATTTVRARSLQGAEWSALAEATFLTGIPATSQNLVISELYYNPTGSAESAEFIELANISGDVISLAGVAFTGGVEFAFPADATLAPGERLLLVADREAFEAAFGDALPVAGNYTGRLDNGGESLTLTAGGGSEIVQSFRYDDRQPWPLPADGDGYSLTLVAPGSNPNPGEPESWRSSVAPGGSPGGSDAVAFSGDTEAELLAHALGEPAWGIDIAVQTLEVNGVLDDYLVALVPRNLAADDVIYGIEFSDDLKVWEKGLAGYLGSGAAGGTTTTSAWRAPEPISDPAAPRFARLVLSLRTPQ